MAENKDFQRPKLKQLIPNYVKTPEYIRHTFEEDQLAILVCLIKIWKAKDKKWFEIPKVTDKNCLVLRECESIEVSDSTKSLIGKAVVKFPRGTIIRNSYRKDDNVLSGNTEEDTQKLMELCASTNYGEVLTRGSSTYESDGASTTSMDINLSDIGLLNINSTSKETALLRPCDLAIGNRIEIRCGYAYSETEFEYLNSSNGEDLDLVFTGFITTISPDTPLELECSNMAHVFTTKGVPAKSLKNMVSVKTFFNEDGPLKLLNDTGIELSPHCQNSEIYAPGGSISSNLTVADVLSSWSKVNILCMMQNHKDGTSTLTIGRDYCVGLKNQNSNNPLASLRNDRNYITYNADGASIPIIQFDWDVAVDKLTTKSVDKKYLAIEAVGYAAASVDKIFKLVIRRNPDGETSEWTVDDNQGEFDVVNEKSPTIKGKKKPKLVISKMKNKVSLDNYTVVHYVSTKMGITKNELVEEAMQYWQSHSPNGISGGLSIFGDIFIKPTDIVGLVDPMHPEKNGYYFVESVDLTFGSGGYRRDIKLPYKVTSFAGNVTIIK